MKHLWQDLLHNGGSPSTVDSSGFIKGENLACTPGAVVFRNEVLELLQYTPAGASVYKTPMLLIPPQINKYYFTDLAPGRSLVEYAVSQGLQMFVVSWRNPTAEQSSWTMDTYVGALYEAVDAMLAISRSPKFNSIGFCAGGITQSCLAAHMAAVGDQRLNSIGYAVTLLDWQIPSMMGLLQSDTLLKLAKRRSGHKGLLAGADLNRVFAWFRPNDLVWNYWVNNYLMGRTPPAFDILAWNADGTNLPAGLLLQYLDIFQDNKLAKPGAFEVLGTPIDLGKITVDAYLTGGVTDHLTPWQGCYRSSQLLGSKHKRFILSSSGHIASLVNPPGNPKASYFVGPNPDMDAGEWQSQAQQCQGSWWEDWIVWTGERSGEKKRAPRRLGSARHPELVAAPGTYIYG